MPEAPPKETRTDAPESVSAEIRDCTAESSIASVPFHAGVHASPSAITNARLYAAADPASSRSEASVASTYGAYVVDVLVASVASVVDSSAADGA